MTMRLRIFQAAFLLTFIFGSAGHSAVDWSEKDLRNVEASIERELDASLARDFPDLEAFTERERLAVFYAFIAQDPELSQSLNVKTRPEEFSAYREGRVELSEGDISKLQSLADTGLRKTSRELRAKLKELKLPMGLPAKFTVEGVKALVALNAAFLSSMMLATGGVPEFSDTAAGLRTLTMLSAIYLAALPIRLPTILQRHFEKLEAAKAARATAERTHQISPAMNRLWFLTKELKRRLSMAQVTAVQNQCRLLFVSAQ